MTIRPRADLDRVVEFLNKLNAHDPQGIKALLEARVPFKTGTIEAVPGLQGYRVETPTQTIDLIGFLGVLNGIFGMNEAGEGPFAALYDYDQDNTPTFKEFMVVRRQG